MELRVEVYTVHQISQALSNHSITMIYAPYSIITEKYFDYSNKIVLVPPVFLADCEDGVIQKLAELKEHGFCNAVAHTMCHIEMLSSLGFRIFGGYMLNCTNTNAIEAYNEYGVSDIIVSPELSSSQINNITTNIQVNILEN